MERRLGGAALNLVSAEKMHCTIYRNSQCIQRQVATSCVRGGSPHWVCPIERVASLRPGAKRICAQAILQGRAQKSGLSLHVRHLYETYLQVRFVSCIAFSGHRFSGIQIQTEHAHVHIPLHCASHLRLVSCRHSRTCIGGRCLLAVSVTGCSHPARAALAATAAAHRE